MISMLFPYLEHVTKICKSRRKLLIQNINTNGLINLETMIAIKKLNIIPFKLISSIFISWSNSNYAPVLYHAGFYCDDASLKHIYHGDSINIYVLLFILLVGYILLIYICELILNKINLEQPPAAKNRWKFFAKQYMVGLLYCLTATELLKVTFGRLRPHFFHTCIPDMSSIKCSEGLITNYTCTGLAPKWLIDRDIYRSFPSGHASLSMYAFIFIYGYMNFKTQGISKSSLALWLKRVVVSATFTWSVVCCFTRILDRRHFWWDVIVGVLIGLSTGSITVSMTLKSKK